MTVLSMWKPKTVQTAVSSQVPTNLLIIIEQQLLYREYILFYRFMHMLL